MHNHLNLTQSWFGYAALVIFVTAYLLVIFEEALHLRKSKPVLMAAGLIWALIGMAYTAAGTPDVAKLAAEHVIFEYGELFLFLLVAITYVNTLEERRVFEVLKGKLTSQGLSYRQLFWLTGVIAFFLSGVLDNLTTALIMGSVVLAVGTKSPAFMAISCISIVVAANAGGAFTPFGDITTLMVWQKGKLTFFEFFALFIPSAINWLVPAVLMSFGIPKETPAPVEEKVTMKPGGLGVVLLFALTIFTAISFKNFLGLQPALGMMLGLGYLHVWSYFLQQKGKRADNTDMVLNSFKQIERVEWDTLLFFFGIIFAVGGLGVMGYLTLANEYFYTQWGATLANVMVGILSAIVDNIPIMFAVLTMDPQMSHGQWLLVTLTAGVGGSLLSIGSAAGVALMGIAQGRYTFSSHLKWTWAVALGYAASIGTHLIVNASKF
jgi:Na+/H+ antiporter NhaD/arsenite permease-like protein